MKKVYTIFMVMALCVVAFACGKKPTISYSTKNLTLNVGSSYVLEQEDIVIKNSKKGYEVKIEDSEIASIEGLKITPIKKGNTKIIISLIGKSDVKFEIDLTVTAIVYATSGSIEKDEMELNLIRLPKGSNKLTLSDGTNEVPEIFYGKTGIVEYNYLTGEVKGLKAGTTTVILYFNNFNVGFRVTVSDLVYVSSMTAQDIILFNNEEGFLLFDCYPNFANTFKFFSNSELIEVEENGSYKTLGLGIADITYEYKTSENAEPSVGSFKVRIVNKFEEFNVKIVNSELVEVEDYFYEKVYKMVVGLDSQISPKQIEVSENINVLTPFLYQESVGWFATISFTDYGRTPITVKFKTGIEEEINQEKTLEVYGYKDFIPSLKCGIYILMPIGGDKPNEYNYSLTDMGGTPINLGWQFKGNIVDAPLVSYIKSQSGEKEIITNNIFYPLVSGRQTIYFEMNGVLRATIILIIQ